LHCLHFVPTVLPYSALVGHPDREPWIRCTSTGALRGPVDGEVALIGLSFTKGHP
jgi:hypothetical protein